MRKKSTFLLAVVCLTMTPPLWAQNNAFKLTGSNYITGQDPIDANNQFTVEFWAFIPFSSNDGNPHQLISEGQLGQAFYIGFDEYGVITAGDNWAGTGLNSTGISMPFGAWTHFAMTFDNSIFVTTLYINGQIAAQSSNFGFQGGANDFTIGTSVDLSAALFAARIQNLAVYDYPRDQATIKADMFASPDLSSPDLTLYWSMNTPDLTTVDNTAATTGASQNGLIIGDDGSNSYVSSPVQYSTNALTFNGGSNQVVINANAAYDLAGTYGGTVEFWMNPSSVSTDFATILGVRGDDGVRYSLHLSSTQLGIDNGTDIAMTTLDLPDTLQTTGVWHHWAFVYNGSNKTSVYLNGVLLGSIDGTFNNQPGEQLTFGQAYDATLGFNETAFNGSLDEVRFWNYPRTATDIQANMGNTLTGTESGLVGEFSFDEGVPGGDNTGLTTSLDNSVTGNSGTMQFFSLTGASSNFTLHTLSAVPLPLTLTQFTADKDGNESLLQWQTAQEQNTGSFIIQRSTDGQTYTSIGSVDAAGNSHTVRSYSYTDRNPQPNANYYRLKESDLDGNFTYSPIRVVNFPVSGRLIWYTTGHASVEVYLQHGANEYYTLSDMSGRLLRLGQLSGGKMQVSGLPAGAYVVRITTNTGPLVTRIIL
ncbi:MAG TPA: LamG-like jellyroll fold domain-containing protein [Puia sp.]|nr:LamG-like jellyroll fold domain-containing protein [Puia sp.]